MTPDQLCWAVLVIGAKRPNWAVDKVVLSAGFARLLSDGHFYG